MTRRAPPSTERTQAGPSPGVPTASSKEPPPRSTTPTTSGGSLEARDGALPGEPALVLAASAGRRVRRCASRSTRTSSSPFAACRPGAVTIVSIRSAPALRARRANVRATSARLLELLRPDAAERRARRRRAGGSGARGRAARRAGSSTRGDEQAGRVRADVDDARRSRVGFFPRASDGLNATPRTRSRAGRAPARGASSSRGASAACRPGVARVHVPSAPSSHAFVSSASALSRIACDVLADARVLDRDEHLDPVVEVARHEVGAADVRRRVARRPRTQ